MPGAPKMYQKTAAITIESEKFEIPFEWKLSEENRWVIMAKLIPWQEFEEEYAKNFSKEIGAPAKSFRIALGALIIKERLGTSDRETVEQIRENPYLQYFLGMSAYRDKAPFEASMLVHFRERISGELINVINRKMVSPKIETSITEAEKKKTKNKKARKEIKES